MLTRKSVTSLISLVFLFIILAAYAERTAGQTRPITLQVDAREAQRRIFHSQLTIPATPGPLTLYYPKWIPGDHAPTGPIVNLVGLRMSAAGASLVWRRDDVDMYAFHVDVPQGATGIDVSLDYVSPSAGPARDFDPAASDRVLFLSWNLVTLYPAGPPVTELVYKPSLLLPPGWKLGTALAVRNQSSAKVEFEPVSLYTLIDSPVVAGVHYRMIPLAASGMPPEEMDIAADSETDLAVPQNFAEGYIRLMQESETLFGAHHFGTYHFLVALSDHLASPELEHHESTDDEFPDRALIDVEMNRDVARLLAHELAHSWNGKYRRPAGLITSDYQQSMRTELLWVYEGLTTYLGDVLTVRSGFLAPEEFRESLASVFAESDHAAGRAWRPLSDAAISAPIDREVGPEWESWPFPGAEWGSYRRLDYYNEGELLWLEADTIIRRLTNDRRSLDEFCYAFFGPPSGPPTVKPYAIDDLVAALNEVAPYDWRGFFRKRVYDVAPHAPLGGIEQAGWKVIYNEVPNHWVQRQENLSHVLNLLYSVGIIVQQNENGKQGTIVDVVPGMAAAEAGIAPGMKLVAVNRQPWSPEILLAALKSPTTPPRLELLVENAGFPRTYNLKYGDGPRYPHLERDPSRPDLLGEIVKRRALASVPAD